MKTYVAVTDNDWYRFLAVRRPDEVNFWKPGNTSLTSLLPGEMVLFKLKAPRNHIAGGGVFTRFTRLPLSLAWLAFGERNGVPTEREFLAKIRSYRTGGDADPTIGCVVLTSPFFLPEERWIPVNDHWHGPIVAGKNFDLSTPEGGRIWDSLSEALAGWDDGKMTGSAVEEIRRFGAPRLVEPRLGQGAFRILVTDAYARRCAITGEKTLPVLEAAHIRPYSHDGPHRTDNGLLLRSDLHILFDRGYMTVTPDLNVEVSPHLESDFGNGRIYYALQGQQLRVLPENLGDRPLREFLEWHNSEIFRP